MMKPFQELADGNVPRYPDISYDNLSLHDDADDHKSPLEWLKEIATPGQSGATEFNMSSLLNASWNFNFQQHGRIINKPEKIIALIFSIVGIIANLFSLIAIARVRGILTANLRLIISLCSSDMLISISILFFISHTEMSLTFGMTPSDPHDVCLFVFARNLRMTAQIISLLNLLGLALDHYFAILRPLDHPTLLCRSRANAMIAIFWIASLLCGYSDFFLPFPQYSFCSSEQNTTTFCEAAFCNSFNSEYVVFAIAMISFVMMMVLYSRIYVEILRYQAFQHQHRHNVRRNRRGLITTFFLVLTFLLTWLPYNLYEIIAVIDTAIYPGKQLTYFHLTAKIDFYLHDILLLNSIFDPMIYALRMREVQYGYKCTIQSCCSQKQLVQRNKHRSFEMRSSTRNSLGMVMTTISTKPDSTSQFV